ncbi:hypothetical protein RchiOBHm_Chr6g0260321 [Rosa chinensis]|uniref:Uncharacterized protein n=1 Tax=Rosa chinensis TaxID=74649 RepID=A0A2P6PN34_ROSCH|nr:hypothetical protein RchiOBHm_Chr6g0260321 [Rosa chinensis]
MMEFSNWIKGFSISLAFGTIMNAEVWGLFNGLLLQLSQSAKSLFCDTSWNISCLATRKLMKQQITCQARSSLAIWNF